MLCAASTVLAAPVSAAVSSCSVKRMHPACRFARDRVRRDGAPEDLQALGAGVGLTSRARAVPDVTAFPARESLPVLAEARGRVDLAARGGPALGGGATAAFDAARRRARGHRRPGLAGTGGERAAAAALPLVARVRRPRLELRHEHREPGTGRQPAHRRCRRSGGVGEAGLAGRLEPRRGHRPRGGPEPPGPGPPGHHLRDPVVGGPNYTAVAGAYTHEVREHVTRVTAELDAQRPIKMPLTVIYSRRDGIVAWRACIDRVSPDAEHVEVRSTHIGMGVDPDVWAVVAERLHRPG